MAANHNINNTLVIIKNFAESIATQDRSISICFAARTQRAGSLPSAKMATLLHPHHALGPRRSIQQLPVELINMCMSAMSCPTDIHAAIRSSPVFYRAFLAQKHQVLISMLRQTMSPESVSLALRIVHCPA